MDQPILELQGISRSFGPVRALDDVSVSFRRGEAHVLVGENGAGKSTLLKIISGLYPADRGTMLLDGTPVRFRSPLDAEKAGIGMVYQELTVLPDMTVGQNVFLHHEPRNRIGLLDRGQMRREFERLSRTFQIELNPDDLVGELPLDKRQLVEVLKVLNKDPRILIFDEPTSSLDADEVRTLHDIIRMLLRDGRTVLYISHRLSEVFAIGHRATVLKDGKYVATRDMGATTPDELVRLMIGRPLQSIFPPKSSGMQAAKVFEVCSLSLAHTLHDISFVVRRGEVLGIAALQGHGQTELFNCIAGLSRKDSGRVLVNGREVSIRSAKAAIRAGIGYIPEDRKTQGLLLNLSIRKNVSIVGLFLMQVAGFIRLGREKRVVRQTMKTLSIRAAGMDQLARELSGGNQQKIVLGKGLAISPRVLLFNEPTRGIDVEAKHDFYMLMRRYADEGIAVVIYSSDLIELIGMSDTVIILYEGRVTGTLGGADITEENIMRRAVGMGGER